MTTQPNLTPSFNDLPIALRAYAIPTWRELPDKFAGKPKKPRKDSAPASQHVLTFDTETTTDASQALRFGTYQWRTGGVLIEEGIFYDPEGVEDRLDNPPHRPLARPTNKRGRRQEWLQNRPFVIGQITWQSQTGSRMMNASGIGPHR